MKAIPVRFPDHAEVIFRDAQRLSTLTASERLAALLRFLAEGELVRARSPNREADLRLRLEERAKRRIEIRRFLARHDG